MPAFPSTPVIDNCTRADESPLANGSLWATGASGLLISTDFHLKLLTNQVVAAGASFGSAVTTRAYGPDQELYVVATGAEFGSNLWVRTQNPGLATLTGYEVTFDASANTIKIDRWDSSTVTVSLVVATAVTAYAAADQVGVSIVGSRITAYVNGVPKLYATDATYARAGLLALRKFSTQMPITSIGGGSINTTLFPPSLAGVTG